MADARRLQPGRDVPPWAGLDSGDLALETTFGAPRAQPDWSARVALTASSGSERLGTPAATQITLFCRSVSGYRNEQVDIHNQAVSHLKLGVA